MGPAYDGAAPTSPNWDVSGSVDIGGKADVEGEEIEARRKAFIRKWRLKHRAVADSLGNITECSWSAV